MFPMDSCAGEVVFIGPGVPGLGSQSRWKYIVAHEIGHQVQLRVLKDWPGPRYTFPKRDGLRPDQTCFGVACDPVEAPELCSCAHITVANRHHCLQSLERDEDAQLEGFAHFFAAKVWNAQDQDDCWFNYYKELLDVACPPGVEDEQCKPFDGLIRAAPPVPFSCKQPTKWRNRHCPLPQYATEFDWMGFYWSVNTSGDPGRLRMRDLFDVYRRACSRDGVDGCGDGDNVSWEALLQATHEVFSPMDQRALRFESAGFTFGVDRNTQ
jgi:hypothetical protein